MIYEFILISIGVIISLIIGLLLMIYTLFKHGLIDIPDSQDISIVNQHASSSNNASKSLLDDSILYIDKDSESKHSSEHNLGAHHLTSLAGWVRIKTTYLIEDGFDEFPDYCLVTPYRSKRKKKMSTETRSPKDQKSKIQDINNNIRNQSENRNHNYYKYLFLKNNLLFIYSSDKREHCDGVVSLANDCIVTLLPETLLVEELFCKQYPIRITNHLTPIIGSSHTCYIYAVNCSEKEDWYTAFSGACRDKSFIKSHKYHIPTFESHIKDIQSPLLDQGSQWFNALLIRMFINSCMSINFEKMILEKLNRKTSRLRKPFFVGDVIVKQVELGTNIPLLSKCQLHSFEFSGEVNVSADILYTGGFQVVITTTARLELPKMKPIIIPLLLSILVQRISGRILLRIKAPPTDRIWIGFYELPNMHLKIDPIISTKSISLAMVNSIIQKRIEDIVLEYMVLPNMDDWMIPTSRDEESTESQESDCTYSYSSIIQSLSRRHVITKSKEMEEKNTNSELVSPLIDIRSTSLPSLPLRSTTLHG